MPQKTAASSSKATARMLSTMPASQRTRQPSSDLHQNTSFFASGSPGGGLMMVVSSSGRRALQKAFLQSPCLRTRQFSVAMEVRRRRDEYCSTGAYFSLFSQRRPSRLPRTTMRDLARSGAEEDPLPM